MSQPVSDSLALLSASVVPALEATSEVAAKVTAASSEYIAAKHRLDAVLDEAAHIRGQKRAAALVILSKKRSLGVDIVESSHDAETNDGVSPVALSVSEVCDGVLQVLRRLPRCCSPWPLTPSPGSHCCQIRSDSTGRPSYRVLSQQARRWRCRLHGAAF